jgi:hypothetical protein
MSSSKKQKIDTNTNVPGIDDIYKKYLLNSKPGWEAKAHERHQLFKKRLGKWIDAHPDDANRTIARDVASHVRYITQAEFDAALAASVKWLRDKLEEGFDFKKNEDRRFGPLDIHLVLQKGKSSAWVAKKSLSLLQNVAVKSVFSYTSAGVEISDHETETAEKSIVFFDDASYSGGQLKEVVAATIDKFYDQSPKPSSGGKKTKFYIVVPFMSKPAYKHLVSTCRQLRMRVGSFNKVSGSMETGTVIEIGHGNLEVYVNPVPSTNVIALARDVLKPHKNMSVPVFLDSGLTTLDHKTPDEVSFFAPLRRGQLVTKGKLDKVLDMTSNPNPMRDYETAVTKYKGVPFLNLTNNRPYVR